MLLRKTAMRTAAVAAAIATTIAGGAVAAPVAVAQGSSNDPAPAFYQPPTDLPDGPGTFVKTQPFPLAGAIPPIPGAEHLSDGAGALSTDAQRIMYTSIGSRGQEIAVTGAYLQPRTPWTGPGTRPLAVVAPGTQGQGDHCAPSKSFQNLANVRTDPPGIGFGYEIIQEPSPRPWLLALEMPVEVLPPPGLRAWLQADLQLLASAPVDARARYRVSSSLQWQAGLDENAESLRPWLALPKPANVSVRTEPSAAASTVQACRPSSKSQFRRWPGRYLKPCCSDSMSVRPSTP